MTKPADGGASGNVIRGRFTTATDEDLVLFLVEVRINRLCAVREWLPVVRKMRPMVRALEADRDSGLLGYHQWRGRHGITMLQYWSDTESLLAFAHADLHRQAWKDFYRSASATTSLGIWHETFVVPAGNFESIYGNVPALGIAGFRAHQPIRRRMDSAAQRLRAPIPAAARAAAAAAKRTSP